MQCLFGSVPHMLTFQNAKDFYQSVHRRKRSLYPTLFSGISSHSLAVSGSVFQSSPSVWKMELPQSFSLPHNHVIPCDKGQYGSLFKSGSNILSACYYFSEFSCSCFLKSVQFSVVNSSRKMLYLDYFNMPSIAALPSQHFLLPQILPISWNSIRTSLPSKKPSFFFSQLKKLSSFSDLGRFRSVNIENQT